MKECFLMYKSFYEPTKFLSLEHKGLLYTAIMEYQANGTIIDLPSEVKMAFNFFLNQFRLDDDKYVEKCNKAKESVSKRYSNTKNTNEENELEKCESIETHTNVYERIQSNTKATDNDNVLKKDISSLRSDISKEKKQNPTNNPSKTQNITQTESSLTLDSRHLVGSSAAAPAEFAVEKEEFAVEVKPRAAKFKKPTVEEVREFCLERKNSVDAESFVNHYEAKGWLIGKTPMKNWQAAVRQWERQEFSTRGVGSKRSGITNNYSTTYGEGVPL